jgi:hypothetical protein
MLEEGSMLLGSMGSAQVAVKRKLKAITLKEAVEKYMLAWIRRLKEVWITDSHFDRREGGDFIYHSGRWKSMRGLTPLSPAWANVIEG